MQFCISSLLRRKFASPYASSVGGGFGQAQSPAGGKNAFASRCWTQPNERYGLGQSQWQASTITSKYAVP
jgi:hypothetical protein